MIVHRDSKSQIELIAGSICISVQALGHAPAHSVIVEDGFSVRLPLVHPELEVLFFNDSGRQQQAHLTAGKNRLRITMPKRLQLVQILQKRRSNFIQSNFSVHIQFRFKIFKRKASAGKLIKPVLQLRKIADVQSKADSMSMAAEAGKESAA